LSSISPPLQGIASKLTLLLLRWDVTYKQHKSNWMMSKLKTLCEKRATIYTEIDELRKIADGREMTAEEGQRWDTLIADYEKADKVVEQEERFQEVERRQAEQILLKLYNNINDMSVNLVTT
jgi:hypothetical protein